MKVGMSPRVLEQLESHSREAYPEECCGLLIGKIPRAFGENDDQLIISETRRFENTWETPAKNRRYRIDSPAFAHIERELSGSGRGVLGIYHSHPDHAAWPSPFDLDNAWPSFAYVIISVRGGKTADARVWRLTPDRRSFEEGELDSTALPSAPGQEV